MFARRAVEGPSVRPSVGPWLGPGVRRVGGRRDHRPSDGRALATIRRRNYTPEIIILARTQQRCRPTDRRHARQTHPRSRGMTTSSRDPRLTAATTAASVWASDRDLEKDRTQAIRYKQGSRG